MSAADLLAGTVMSKSASLLNDTARTVYTYAAQAPYLTIALQELREYFELHNIPVTQNVSTVINILAGQTTISYNAAPPLAALPTDFVEPQQLWERAEGIDPFVPMTRREYLPHSLEGIPVGQFGIYVWQNQQIKFLPSSRDNDIKMNYIKQLFPDSNVTVDENTVLNVVNAASFLEYRTAALCAEFIERNRISSDSLNNFAVLALDRVTGIGVKGKQAIVTRRRPFRASYKRSSGPM